MITKREYLNCLMSGFTPDQIIKSFNNPSIYMRPIHLKLHRIAYRIKTGKDITK